MKCVFCVPFLDRPTAPFISALEGCLPVIEEAGWEHGLAQHMGNPYISNARADMLRRALDAKADVIVFLDYDVSFNPEDILKLLETDYPVVAGTYRFKNDGGEYMGGVWPDEHGQAIIGKNGCIKAVSAPAGFLKVTKEAISLFAKKYPELLFGDPMNPHLDLFNHGAINGTWYGEDYAFCKRWIETGNDLWILPDINLHHHAGDKVYEGNFHKYLLGTA